MVGDDHYVADNEFLVHAACSVRDDECFDSKLTHDADGEGDLLHVVAFVVVEATRHRHYSLTAESSDNQHSAVTFDGRNREVGNCLIFDDLFVGDFVA